MELLSDPNDNDRELKAQLDGEWITLEERQRIKNLHFDTAHISMSVAELRAMVTKLGLSIGVLDDVPR